MSAVNVIVLRYENSNAQIHIPKNILVRGGGEAFFIIDYIRLQEGRAVVEK